MTALSAAPFSGSAGDWDAFVRRTEGATHYHLAGWKAIMERVLGHDCPYVAVRDEKGLLCGVLPLVRVKSRLFGHYLVSMPFLNYGGPLGGPSAVRALVRWAVSTATESGADLLELRGARDLGLDMPVSHRKVTVVLELPREGPEALWKALSAKVRSQIRRPQKENAEVRFGLDQVEAFFSVFAHHMRDLGTPTHSRVLFETIAEAFPDDVHFGVVYHLGRPVAAGCGFRWGETFEMTWASSLRAYSKMAPNMLLYWRFIERCVAEGVRYFDFGRCTPGGGTHRFKRQWGGEDRSLWWYQSSRGRVATPSPDDRTYAWGPRLWRRLPVPVATAIGPRIVRLLP